MDEPTRSLIDDIESIVITKYPGLDTEEVFAALEVVKLRLLRGETEKE